MENSSQKPKRLKGFWTQEEFDSWFEKEFEGSIISDDQTQAQQGPTNKYEVTFFNKPKKDEDKE